MFSALSSGTRFSKVIPVTLAGRRSYKVGAGGVERHAALRHVSKASTLVRRLWRVSRCGHNFMTEPGGGVVRYARRPSRCSRTRRGTRTAACHFRIVEHPADRDATPAKSPNAAFQRSYCHLPHGTLDS